MFSLSLSALEAAQTQALSSEADSNKARRQEQIGIGRNGGEKKKKPESGRQEERRREAENKNNWFPVSCGMFVCRGLFVRRGLLVCLLLLGCWNVCRALLNSSSSS